jgi:signal transduction histidine kinase
MQAMGNMRRIRIVFVILAMVLLLPLGLLLDRALDSIAAERELRHQAVAERIFDEMERELTRFLRREEDRPFEQYRFFYIPEGGSIESIELSPSPLASPAEEEFIVGYFQVDPDGTVASPLEPQNKALAETIAGWRSSAEIDARVERVRSMVELFWDTRSRSNEQLTDDRSQSPGTTVALKEGRDAALESQTLGKYGSGSALSDLNRGASLRKQQAEKVSKSASQIYNFSRDESENVLQQEAYAQQAMLPEHEGLEMKRAVAPTQEIRDAIEQTLQTKATDSLDVDLEPMVGRVADADHLFLYRTVLIGSEAYRQGMLLDIPKLVNWLSDAVLVDSELAAHVHVASTSAKEEAESEPLNRSGYLYRHQFAEPFSPVAGVLRLAPLPEAGGVSYVYWLALLLGLAATLGLFSLYRMVEVAVGYAQRRHNFVSAVTHELKTPLTAIRLYGEMLRDGIVPSKEKRQQYYRVITAETERLTRLVNNVLELARLERKDRPLNMTVGDVAPLVEEVVSVLDPHAEQEGFVLQVEVDPDLPSVRYDRDALLQVLFNLVDNAIKYSRDAPTKEITISCRKEKDGLLLSVADRGPGVPPHHLKGIFQPFYRAENELTRSSKGTGIGLALVRGLVERMGGSVRGENARTGGFVVRIFFLSPARKE